MSESFTEAQTNWLERVLGMRFGDPNGPVPRVPPPPPDRGAKEAFPPDNHPRSGKPIRPSGPVGPKSVVLGANGKRMEIARTADGHVSLKAPPPPVKEITFSGGGGKGAALPGAVRALEKSGILKDVAAVNGASVGSMTAALVAAGITAEEFEQIGNDPAISKTIMQGKNLPEAIFGGGLTGQGLEDLVRSKLTGTLQKRILEYIQKAAAGGKTPDPTAVAIARRLAEGKTGPTFGDMRTLSKIVPGIKEVTITGSYMASIDGETGKAAKHDQPQLAIFSADTEPKMEIALAVHASAALPPVFKPVDIELDSGLKAQFQDGGVLNNAPTSDNIGATRDVDPVPEKSSMTFVFEDDASKAILNGKAAPDRSPFQDWLTGAEFSAATYGKNRSLADRPEDVVMVPLTYTVPGKKKGGKRDFTGPFSGTANFGMNLEEKLTLQAMADAATTAHIAKQMEPRTREFDSEDQMLMCVGRDDLAAMARNKIDGAANALEFRDAVTATVATLTARAGQMTGDPAATMTGDPEIRRALARLDQLSAGDLDRQGFVAREVNRSGKLDRLIDAERLSERGGTAGEVLEACLAVSDALRAKAHAKTILRDAIYPKMVREDPKGVGGTVLAQVDTMLRRAHTPDDVNDALQIAIRHFRTRPDLRGWHKHKKFAALCESYLMKPA